jgi:hypothetical protein
MKVRSVITVMAIAAICTATGAAQSDTRVDAGRPVAAASATASPAAPAESQWCGNGAETTPWCYEVGHRTNRDLPDPDGRGLMTFHMCPDGYAVAGTNMLGLYCGYVGPYTSIYVATGKLENDERRDFTIACKPGTFMVGEAGFGRRLACATIGVPVTGERPLEIGTGYAYGYCAQAVEGLQISVVTSWQAADRRVRCAVIELPPAILAAHR